MNKKTLLILSLLIFSALLFSGCIDFFTTQANKRIYTSHPTKISYTIKYGYHINTSGTGDYEITYDCYLPQILKGTISTYLLYEQDNENKIAPNNNFIRWNIKNNTINSYQLGIMANVEAETFMISDLTGNNSLDIPMIKNRYPTIFSQYTKNQIINNQTFIDTNNSNIKTTAQNILNESGTKNAFIVAKNLFIWLKENTEYKTHSSNEAKVQPATVTYQKKTGDCDDLSILYISICRSIDIPARLVRGYLIEEKENDIIAIPHAWVEVFVGGDIGYNGWISVECACTASNCDAQIDQNFAIESVDHLRVFVDYGSNESLNASISGPRIKYDETQKIDIESFAIVTNYKILESKELVVEDNTKRYYQ
ncbi:MAG TPA: transglutaminase domain-containing protein [Thermoplasmatales archaeon]|nr:transglutaminase domain-containing protein [Thermoplasmatales archaeon]HEX08616.1 transglutaminase domain-containing protein [Thermoplasmatales archaeon]